CLLCDACFFFFFFQAEDGIRDFHVTGVQTCALPILRKNFFSRLQLIFYAAAALPQHLWDALGELAQQTAGERIPLVSAWGSTEKIGRASCRERVEISVGAVAVKKKRDENREEGETVQ